MHILELSMLVCSGYLLDLYRLTICFTKKVAEKLEDYLTTKNPFH